MKELEEPLRLTPTVVKEIQKQIESTYKGSILKKRGLTMFTLNLYTLEMDVLVIKHESVFDMKSGKGKVAHKASHNPQCIYLQCLNKKSAMAKARKLLRKYRVPTFNLHWKDDE